MSKGYECVQGQHGSRVESQHWSVGGERLPVESPDVSAPHRLPAASRQGQTVSDGGLLGLCDRLQTEWLSCDPVPAFRESALRRKRSCCFRVLPRLVCWFCGWGLLCYSSAYSGQASVTGDVVSVKLSVQRDLMLVSVTQLVVQSRKESLCQAW